jgi:hypothetical protein
MMQPPPMMMHQVPSFRQFTPEPMMQQQPMYYPMQQICPPCETNEPRYQVLNPNPPLLVPVIPTQRPQKAIETIATSWIPVQAEPPRQPQKFTSKPKYAAARECDEDEPPCPHALAQAQAQLRGQTSSNLMYQAPRTKSVTLNY